MGLGSESDSRCYFSPRALTASSARKTRQLESDTFVRLERHGNAISRGPDSPGTTVFVAIEESKLDSAFCVNFPGACRFRAATVSVVVTYAEPHRHGSSTLLETHLKYALTVQKILVCVFPGKIFFGGKCIQCSYEQND